MDSVSTHDLATADRYTGVAASPCFTQTGSLGLCAACLVLQVTGLWRLFSHTHPTDSRTGDKTPHPPFRLRKITFIYPRPEATNRGLKSDEPSQQSCGLKLFFQPTCSYPRSTRASLASHLPAFARPCPRSLPARSTMDYWHYRRGRWSRASGQSNQGRQHLLASIPTPPLPFPLLIPPELPSLKPADCCTTQRALVAFQISAGSLPMFAVSQAQQCQQ